jgi:hypothetical protein
VRKVLGIVLVLSACGGGGGSATVATIDPKVANQIAVDAAVLQASDLAGNWNTNRALTDSSTSRDKVSEAAAECFRTDGDDVTANALREFLSGPSLGHVIVRGELESHRDATSLTGKLTAFTQEAASSCLKQYILHLFSPGGGVVGDLAITPSKVDGVGDEQGGFLISAPVSLNALDFTIGRATMTVINFDTIPDHALAVAGMKATAHRLAE